MENKPTSVTEERLRTTIEENLSEGIFHLEEGVVTYANKVLFRIFACSSLEEINRSGFHTFFSHPDTIVSLLRSASLGRPFQRRVECIAKDKGITSCQLTFQNIKDGQGSYYVGTLIDISDRLQIETLLIDRNEKLKQVNAQLDRFLYSASHDIRQPLTSMMGLIQLMRLENQYNGQYLDKLQQSIEKLDFFLHEVISFSENSHVRITSCQINLRTLVNDLARSFERELQEKRIYFSVEVLNALPFYSDPKRIGIIIEHILRNSIEYTDTAKTKKFIKVIITHHADHIIIEIIDNGIGIAKGHLSRVTEMFYRATDRSKGSGLGLYIVQETVNKLKGKLSLDSEIQLGTIVHIQVPNDVKGKLINRKKILASKGAA